MTVRIIGGAPKSPISPTENEKKIEGVPERSSQALGMAPHAQLEKGWNFKRAFQKVAVGAVCLAILAGNVSPAAAQIAASVNPPPGIELTFRAQQNTPKKVVVNGIEAGAPMTALNASGRFSGDASFNSYSADNNEAVDRAYIRTEVQPISGGARIQVNSFHKEKGDKVTLWLQAEVLDRESNQFRTITIATLDHQHVINPGSFRGQATYDLNYEDVNKFLKARNPNLSIVPGETSLAVAAMWEGGHQAGGFGRGGIFRLPGATPVASTTGAGTVAGANNNTPLPLDMQVAYPAEMVRMFPQLASDGNMVSRLESELKGTSTKADMTAATKKMYDVWMASQAGNTQEVEARLGQGWKIETSAKFWVKDDGSANQPGQAGAGKFSGYRVNGDGLPLIEPMVDVYMDDAQLSMTRLAGALRLRSNSAGVGINIKPGGGRAGEQLDALLPVILQRIEWGFQMSPGTTPELAGAALQGLSSSAWANTVFNLAQREITALGSKLILSNALDPWLEVTQQRHKFVLTNAEGVSIEFSFDTVKAKTLRPEHANPDGTPREVEFYVLETELDHLATTGSSNQSGTAVVGTGVSSASFSDNTSQDNWLRSTGDQVTMSIDPRLHEVKDLENAGFRSTASYHSFRDEILKVVPWLFPNGLTQGVQKAASSAADLGLVIFDDAKFVPAFERVFDQLGYKWTPQLATEFGALKGDAAKRELAERALAGTARTHMGGFLQAVGGDAQRKLEVNVPQMQARLTGQLRELGFQSSPAVDALVNHVARKGLNVSQLEALFAMDGRSDRTVLEEWTTAAGVSSAPALTADVNLLLGENTRYGRQLRQELVKAGVDAGSVAGVETFLQKAVATGRVDLSMVRRTIQQLSWGPETQLEQLRSSAKLNKAELPVLRATGDHIASKAQRYLGERFFKMDKSVMAFFKAVAQKTTRVEADTWLRSASSFHEGVEKYAEQLGIQKPKFELDVNRLDASIASNLALSHVTFSPEIRTFVHQAVAAGAHANRVLLAMQELGSSKSLSEALARHGVDVSSLTVPDIRYDKKGVASAIQTSWASYAPMISSSVNLDKFIDDCLTAGLTGSQTAQWAQAGVTTSGQYLYGISDNMKSNLPKLQFNVAKVVAEWKTKFASDWSPAKETFLTQALAKSFDDGEFYLGRVYTAPGMPASWNGNTLDSVIGVLAQYSGMTAPSNASGGS